MSGEGRGATHLKQPAVELLPSELNVCTCPMKFKRRGVRGSSFFLTGQGAADDVLGRLEGFSLSRCAADAVTQSRWTPPRGACDPLLAAGVLQPTGRTQHEKQQARQEPNKAASGRRRVVTIQLTVGVCAVKDLVSDLHQLYFLGFSSRLKFCCCHDDFKTQLHPQRHKQSTQSARQLHTTTIQCSVCGC